MLVGQDTIAIDIQKAVALALKNNTLKYSSSEFESDYLSSYSLPPTELSYRYGQLYSADLGWKIELSQDFKNLFCFKAKNELSDAVNNLNKNKNQFDTRKLEIEVKSAYMRWIYAFNILDLIDNKREYALKRISVSNLKTDLGETELIDDVFIEMQASHIETEYLEHQYNLDIIENELRILLNTENHLKPKRKVLEMYMVNKQDDTSAFNGNFEMDIIKGLIDISGSRKKLVGTKLYPHFQAGVFYQNISPYNNLKGIQAGIKIPLWNKPTKEKILKEKIYTEKLTGEYNSKLLQSELEIETLILELDKIFIRIRHYQNHAIPAANLLLNNAAVKYQKEDIGFEEYYEKLNKALKIKQEYLNLILKYNLTALKLEIYTK
jgi:cobalt-zinc-cadmium resistance protein CzcA